MFSAVKCLIRSLYYRVVRFQVKPDFAQFFLKYIRVSEKSARLLPKCQYHTQTYLLMLGGVCGAPCHGLMKLHIVRLE